MIYDPHFLSGFIAPKGSPKQRRLQRLERFDRTPRIGTAERKRLGEALEAFRMRTGQRDGAKS